MSATESRPLFDFYLRYPWGPADFGNLQDSLVGIPRDTFAGLHAAGLLYGGTIAPSGSTLAVTVSAFTALNDDGYLCVKNSTQLVALTADGSNPRYALIVARPDVRDGVTISRPTQPFDSVPLTELQDCTVTAILGTPDVFPTLPAKVAGDVILGSVYIPAAATSISGGNINQTTDTEIGNCVRFNSSAKDVIVQARSGNTIGIQGIGHGTGSGVYGLTQGAGYGVTADGGASGGGLLASATAFPAITAHLSGGATGAGANDDAILSDQNIALGGANPAAGTGFTNKLTPMNLPKAWGRITLGATPTIQSGFNITNPRYSGNDLLVDIVNDLAGAEGVVIPQIVYPGVTANGVASGYVSAAGTVTLEAITASTGAQVNISGLGSALSIHFVVFGAQ